MASMTAQVATRFLALRGTPRPLRETALYSSQRVMPWASTMWSHSERAKWLWLTGHRLSDLRRLVRQYGRTQDQVFPTGQTIFGAPYGSEVNLPIPFQERNNPNATSGACLDRNA